MPLISIVSANIDSPEWAELLIKSIRKFTASEYEIIIIDNGSLPENLTWLRTQRDVRLELIGHNAGHGAAMDMGTRLARSTFVCVMDIDAHFQRSGWDLDLMSRYRAHPKTRMIGCRGPDHKPMKPPLFFFEKQFIMANQLSFRHVPGISTDTAQKVYFDIIDLGLNVERFAPGFKIYSCYGDQFYINSQPSFYHHWYGTRFNEHNPAKRKDELDGYKYEDYLKNKQALFSQDLVKQILEHE